MEICLICEEGFITQQVEFNQDLPLFYCTCSCVCEYAEAWHVNVNKGHKIRAKEETRKLLDLL